MKRTSPHKILIIDDVTKNIQVVASFLKEANYEINFALNGISALEHISHEHFDLILLDIMMPEMDGFEVCRQLKENEETKDVPVIFLTAKTDEESIRRGFEMGGVDYVTKPFNKEELIARVNTHIELKDQKEALKELNVSKDKFFSIIAHDLKSPFNQLTGLSEILLKQINNSEEALNIALMINEAAKTGSSLLKNLMDWARAQVGRIEFLPETINLKSIIDEMIVFLKYASTQKNISIVSNIQHDIFVFADPNMVNTVLRNLLTNAIKFTNKEGKIEINVIDEGEYIRVGIRDNGIGMREEDINKLFRIDVNAKTIGNSKEKGTGLGLILCKEFVEANEGKIWVESQFEEGSEFIFTLPKKGEITDQ